MTAHRAVWRESSYLKICVKIIHGRSDQDLISPPDLVHFQ
jgi:hypothetical protein